MFSDGTHGGDRGTDGECVRLRAPFALTDRERKVFGVLLEVDAANDLGQRYRVAGGWVRDKLLGLESDDIDIALDGMSGRSFVDLVRAYGKKHPGAGIGRSFVVGQNVEKSKHLETATIELHGLKVEFVHLRSEQYATGSRVPVIEVGTPLEDASRRDLTINALFFDLQSGEIEDFVGGLDDLKRMVLRTPAEPAQTFLDDPLRVLRVLRFWSRYAESELHGDVTEAMRDPGLRGAYATKVSSERSGVEMIKLLSGAKPGRSLRALTDCGLIEPVFGVAASKALSDEGDDALVTERFMQGGSDGWHAVAASWFAGTAPTESLDVRAGLSMKCLKQIAVGKSDREFVAALIRGVSLCEREQWRLEDMGRLLRALPEDWWDALRIAGARRSDEQWSADRAHALREYLSRGPILEPLIDGDRVMELLPDFDPRTGFIREVTHKLLDAQATFEVTDVAAAEKYVIGLRAVLS